MSSSSSGHDLSSLKIEDHARHRGGLGKILAYISAGGGLVLIVAGLVFALRTHKPVVEVMAARKAEAGEAATLLNASGYVTPRRRATIAAKITARVTAVYAEEGRHVHEGDILARLDDSDAQVRLASARANRDAAQAAIQDLQVQLTLAERELHRAETLQKEGIDSVEALDTSRAAADSLRAKIALAKEQVNASQSMIAVAQQDVDNCTVRAPFTGEVVSKDAQVGEMVSPISAGGGFTRTGIATVVDMNSNEIEVDVNESFIARVKDGQPVVATLDAYPDWKIPAKVRTVIPTADRQRATVKVRISFDHLDPRILPDMGVKVAFLDTSEQSGNKSKSANAAPQTLIPQDAVIQDGGKPVVFVLHDTKVERRAVNLGGNHGSDVEVFAGITSGESVVVKPPPGLRDGEEVEIKR
ncbi:MAG: efflux RND transporter periplasmic adaptor subunit [Candidatus Acidiferrales bacterium]